MVGMLAVFSVIFYFNYYISDDAFITLRVADNFSNGFGPRWNINERVQVFTSPLHFVITAIPYSVLSHLLNQEGPSFAYLVALSISFLLSLAAIILLLFVGLRGTEGRLLAFILLMSSQAFITFCGSGLETPLLYLVLLLLVHEFFQLVNQEQPGIGQEHSHRRALPFWILSGLCILTRYDVALLIAPMMIFVFVGRFREIRWKTLREVALGWIPVFSWFLFSLIYFGFLFPNSYFAKLGIDVPASVLFSMGFDYLLICFKQDPITPIVLILSIAACWKRQDRIVLSGVVLYVFYIVSIGGDFIGFRFLAYPYLACVYVLVRRHERVFSRLRIIVVLAVPVLLAYNALVVASPPRAAWDGPIGNDVSFWYPRTALRFFVKPLPDVDFMVQREFCGERIEGSLVTRVRRSPAGLGPFCAGPNLHHIDLLGITDPLIARLPALITGPFMPGHITKALPAGYGQPANPIHRRDIGAYQTGLQVITSGDLFTVERWRAIFQYNFGSKRRFEGEFPPANLFHRSLREQYLEEDYPLKRWWH